MKWSKRTERSIKERMTSVTSILLLIAILIESAFFYTCLDYSYDQAIEKITDHLDNLIQSEVQTLISVLTTINQRYEDGEISEEEAFATAKQIVKTARYNNSDETKQGYFWVDDKDGNCIVHNDSGLEQKQRYNLQDEKGNYYIQNLLKAGNQAEGGFTEYWEKNEQNKLSPKRVFTAKFEPFNWYISTGVYTDETNPTIAESQKSFQIKKILGSLVFLAIGLILVLIGRNKSKYHANAITLPLKNIAERLTLLSKGDLSTPVPSIHSHDEIEQLTVVANSLTHDLNAIINDLGTMLAEISKGNFDVHSNTNYSGDFKQLYEGMRNINIHLSRTMAQITESANIVNNEANQVSVSAQTLSQGALEQSESIQQLSDTMQQISEQISETADNTIDASKEAAKAERLIALCNQKMSQLNNAMDNINESSANIQAVIETIEDIAGQTNLLALNAAIEAARAGESGKGFAVVADEIRKLAENSMAAAADTTNLIKNSTEAAKNGKEIADDTSKSMENVIQLSNKISNKIEIIAEASKIQASAVQNINDTISNVSAIIETNSATAEESAATSEELNAQADALSNLVSRFKLRQSAIEDIIKDL